jgi:methionine-rich copper-binding protein CopC
MMRLVPGSPVPGRQFHGPHGRGHCGLLGRVGVALVLSSALSLGGAAPVSAHTALEYTVPADQEQVAQPVTQITVAFDDPVTLVGAGFEVFTPQEVIVEPDVVTEDGMVFILQLGEPLAGGEAGVRYEVTAADGHVLEGGFRFTVPAAAATVPVTVPATVPATVPDTVAPAGTPSPAVTAPAPTSAPVPAVSASVVASDDGDDGGSSTGPVVGVVAALAVAAAAFLVLRSRSNRPT